MNKPREYFTSRIGFLLSLLGVAIGAGNIWRFSRVVAQNGGGSFLIPWIIFLFIWSIPLIIAELAMGKLTRKAPIGALALTAGRKFGWMGAFIAFVATGILFYYSVIVGWGFAYFFYSINGTLLKTTDHLALWTRFTSSYQPLFFHFLAIVVGCYVIYKGIVRGIEKSNKILMPTLFVIIFIIVLRAITLPGSWNGIVFLFKPHLRDLLDYQIWLEALTQNAWDTGAGWGLLLVYAGYIHRKESVSVNGSLTAITNNIFSLIMGIAIFSTAFALEKERGIQELITGEGSSNTGLAFIYLPKLFDSLPGGASVHLLFSALFFLGFSFAALSSQISMLQLTTQVIEELGIKKTKALIITGLMAFIFGTPSALNPNFFENQDWVWSVGLILSGLFIAFGVIRYGVARFERDALNLSPKDFKLRKGYQFFIKILIPVQGILLLSWYFYQSLTALGERWWDPLEIYSLTTLIFQWGLVLLVFFILNRWLVRRTLHH